MPVFNLIAALLFVLSAVLQYNDPDPYLWIPIYLYGAVLCWLAFRRKYYPRLYLAGCLFYAIYAAILFFEKDGVADWINEHNAEDIAGSMKASKPWIEATREFFGLIILIVALLINYFYSRNRNQKKTHRES